MSDTPDDPEIDEFLDKVGQDTDPVKYFINALKECGSEVDELPDGAFEIRKACEYLVTHTSNGFCEILCTKCFIALDIHPIELPDVNHSYSSEDEEDDIDAFLKIAGTEINSGDYPKSAKEDNDGWPPFESED